MYEGRQKFPNKQACGYQALTYPLLYSRGSVLSIRLRCFRLGRDSLQALGNLGLQDRGVGGFRPRRDDANNDAVQYAVTKSERNFHNALRLVRSNNGRLFRNQYGKRVESLSSILSNGRE